MMVRVGVGPAIPSEKRWEFGAQSRPWDMAPRLV